MILMLCGNCQMDMMVLDVQYILMDGGKVYRMIYHIGCENNHKSEIQSDLIILKPDSAEERVVKFLTEQSERKYGQTSSN